MKNENEDVINNENNVSRNISKKYSLKTILLCIFLSAVTAVISSILTVRITLDNSIDTASALTENESATLCREEQLLTSVNSETQTQNINIINETETETTIIYVTVTVYSEQTTQQDTTEHTTETQTEPTTNHSKSSIYATAVHSVVGVSSYYTKYTRTLLGTKSSKQYSNGSGFFVSDDGYILTNAHVVENAEVISVTDYGENTYDAKLIAKMDDNDIAILKINCDSKGVTLGKSSNVSVGDDCMIIGNPMGNLSYTYTDGIISYVNRQIATESGYYLNMYQTNCAINSGNSGGPVFNSEGEVIGVATAKYSTSEGLSFFIPVDDVKTFIKNNIT